MGWWSDIVYTRAQDWVFLPLAGAHDEITDDQYVNVFLQSLHIPYVRKGLNRFFGTVHSYTAIPHRGTGKAEFSQVTTPSTLQNADPKHVEKVILMQQRLLGPIPYRGGDLEVEVGLFSIKAAEMIAPFLNVLEDLSRAAGVSYINVAVPFLAPIMKGVHALTGGDAVLEIGLARLFTMPVAGFFAVIGAPKGEVDPKSFTLDESDYRLKGPGSDQYPYLVLEITGTRDRKDWFRIPDLQASYKQLQQDVREGNLDAIHESLVIFRRVVLTSDDLLARDSSQIADRVTTEVNKVRGMTLMADVAPRELPPLERLW
jgi:hypothetical protein